MRVRVRVRVRVRDRVRAPRGRPEVRGRVARRRRVASEVAVPARGELDEEELEGTAALVQG